MGNYRPYSMKFVTLTEADMLSLKTSKRKRAEKTAKIKCEKRYRFKNATLYEREVIKKKHFLFAGGSIRIHTTGG
jgi:hypothetical protein